jgi:hypothetical protein
MTVDELIRERVTLRREWREGRINRMIVALELLALDVRLSALGFQKWQIRQLTQDAECNSPTSCMSLCMPSG